MGGVYVCLQPSWELPEYNLKQAPIGGGQGQTEEIGRPLGIPGWWV